MTGLEKSRQDSGMLRFSFWDEEEFLAYLRELQLFPENEMEFFEEERTEESSIIPVCTAIFSLFDKETGEQEKSMEIFEKGILYEICLQDRTKKLRQSYRKRECEEILKSWLYQEAER